MNPLLFLCCALSVHAVEPSILPTANARVVQATQAILTNLHSTRYSHKTDVDVSVGQYFCDCSGLGRMILKDVAPRSLKSLPIEQNFHYPRAVSFYSAFTNAASGRQPGWQKVESLAKAEPGDFIAWRRNKIEKGGTSGHVMIIVKKPSRDDDGSYRVLVLDSTSTRHSDDSRSETDTGIGTGTVWFVADENGAPISYRWSARQRKPTTVPISIGRVID